jgi:hypothetical protein
MDGIGIKNLEQTLENHVRLVRDTGLVDAGALANVIPVQFKAWLNNQHQNYLIQILSGAAIYEWSVITASFPNILVINPALTAAPAYGDKIAIYELIVPGGGIPANVDVTEWGGVALTGADITPNIQNIDVALSTIYLPLSAYNVSVGAALTVDLDTGLYGGRTHVEVWVQSSGAANFLVYGSRDNVNFRLTDTIILAIAGQAHRAYFNAYRYIRVATVAANNNEIEIAASR